MERGREEMIDGWKGQGWERLSKINKCGVEREGKKFERDMEG